MKYIYLTRTDRYADEQGVPYTVYGIDVWRLPDRDARLHRSFPGLFFTRQSAEDLAKTLTDTDPPLEAIPELIRQAREREAGFRLSP